MVYTRYFDLPTFNRREILRYAAAREGEEGLDRLLEDCLAECGGPGRGRVCYMTVPLEVSEDEVDLSFARVRSRALARNLRGCGQAVVIAATIGMEMDRRIRRCSRLQPARAVVMQAIGTERIEALCRQFCAELAEEEGPGGLYLRPRFSPGYGDLSLELQKDIVRVLDCYKHIGVGLNESLLMTPSKSVTAIVGLSAETCSPRTEGCSYCDREDCAFRKETES